MISQQVSFRQNDTAFSYRDSNWAKVIVGGDPDQASNPKIISWTNA